MIKVKHPVNLSAIIFKCDCCGSLVRYYAKTGSYYLIKASEKIYKDCNYCLNLSKHAIPESIGLDPEEKERLS